jgi:hypothetical protein
MRGSGRQGVSAVVTVGDTRISTSLRAKPRVGATLDVGFPVIVVQTKDVAGGGVIVAATRLDQAASAD